MGLLDGSLVHGGGWTYYGGPKPWAAGLSGLMEGFLKSYALMKNISLDEAKQELAERQAEQARKESEEKIAAARTRREQEAAFREKVRQMYEPTTEVLPERLHESSLGPTRTIPPTGITMEGLMRAAAEHGTPEEAVKITAQLLSARNVDEKLANALEQVIRRVESNERVADARNQAAQQIALIHGLYRVQGAREGKEDKEDKNLKYLSGELERMQQERSKLIKERDNARLADRPEFNARIAELDSQINEYRRHLQSNMKRLGIIPEQKAVSPGASASAAKQDPNFQAAVEYLRSARTPEEAKRKAAALKNAKIEGGRRWTENELEAIARAAGWI